MIYIKTAEEIEAMRRGGKILAGILRQVSQEIKPGISAAKLDQLAEELIIEAGGQPSFKGYQGSKNDLPFPSTLCVSVNDEIVHGPAAPEKIIKTGDLVGLDIGMKYESYFTDMAITIGVGKLSKEAKKLIKVTRAALELAISKARPGIYWREVAVAIQDYVERNGFSVVKALTGHGVGRLVHEDPKLPNFTGNVSFDRVLLEENMTLAIEPMVNMGSAEVKSLPDGWTIVTADGQPSAHFEHTIILTKDGAEILTV